MLRHHQQHLAARGVPAHGNPSTGGVDQATAKSRAGAAAVDSFARQKLLEHPAGRNAFLVAWHALPSYFEDPAANRAELARLFFLTPQEVSALEGPTIPRISFRNVRGMERRRHDPAVRQAIVTLRQMMETCGRPRSRGRLLEVFDISPIGANGWEEGQQFDLASLQWDEAQPVIVTASGTGFKEDGLEGGPDLGAAAGGTLLQKGDADEQSTADEDSPHRGLGRVLESLGLRGAASDEDEIPDTREAQPGERFSSPPSSLVVEPERDPGGNGRADQSHGLLHEQNVALTRENATLRESLVRLEQQMGELRELMQRLAQNSGPDAPHVISIQRTTGEQVVEVILKIRVSGSESGETVRVEV